ncbi:aminoglycoside phosphotransferase family protein [Celeribacter neptunius]|uniref:Aminoglycoside phosphotransferase domain-containing protein n=1 Tax=Celeribacter neptunius TaxID=588602 RepID=A0A1I3SGL3_9RHOB|nr:phosphotransferase [Celeribacter neptunius]SFJ57878.1 hypothetical protein SAMN04487991_2464 [Celeribacter neptunius]
MTSRPGAPSAADDRAQALETFVSTTDWAGTQTTALAGDASRRRYFRLTDPTSGRTAILMDAPPDAGEDVRPFLKVAAYLRNLSLSAPDIYAADEEQGFLILEDFGNDLYDQVCARDASLEPALYDAAVDVLVALAQAPAMEGLAEYGPLMSDLALSCYRWYAEPILGQAMGDACEEARSVLNPLLSALGPGQTTILRDYHAQNLLWLPDRGGPAKVGLLDFQDAMLGPVAYDLISLTTDARRDVPEAIQSRCMDRFVAGLGLNPSDFSRDAAICSVQRNLRILMIFGRMSLHFGKPHYVDLIPRVWGHLQRDLDHPELGDLAAIVRRHLPEPTQASLNILKAKCGTIPTLQ